MKKYFFLFIFLILSHLTIGQDINLLLSKLDTQKENSVRSELMYRVAGEYQRQGAYKKAIEYYNKSLQTFQAGASEVLITKEKISQNYAQLKDYKNAVNINEEILDYYRTHAQEIPLVKMLNETSDYCQYGEMYDKALIYNTELVKIHQKNNAMPELNQVYNNLGIIYRRQGNQAKSAENFNKAIEINKNLLREKKSRSEVDAFTQINTGVTYLQLKEYKKANFYFEEAIKVADSQKDKKLQAAAYNFGAMAYYLSDENNTALTYVTQAQAIAEENKDEENLLIAYQTLAQIYQSEENYKDAQDFQLRYQELKSKLEKQKQQAIQQSLEKEVEVEKKESEMKSLIAEKDRQEAALKQSELERQKQEQELKLRQNELVLLRKNQELQVAKFAAQEAEQRRIEQLLELTKQKAETEKQRLLADAQSQETERQRLIAKQKELESNVKSRDLLSARVEQRLQAEKFEQEKYIRYLGVGLIGLVLGILFFVYRGLRITKKLNNQLSDKNKEIEQANITLQAKQEEINVQNEELQQTQEEVLAQRDAVELANRSLEKTNQDIRDSITYASRIQQAVLPSMDTFQAKLPESFVFYKPRDIVSGDFYWLEEIENKIILIVADCTGHGVPGAFTSMLGGAGLAEIVFQKRILEPEKILNELHLYIRNSLKQRITQSRDGMDVAIALIDKATNTLTYAGAKNPIIFIQNGELQQIKGDKMPIGGEQREIERIFTKHIIPLDVAKTTTFYLFSDGYQDQFGGINNRKFSSAQMRNLLLQIHEKEMGEQKNILKETINKWQEEGKEEQLDDILVVGVKI
jgi:serine phosphatase RsbU (regulator of sigma subunit)/tetratricopeptide (TPR) repeat protein